jgi:hypothetical protein
MLQWNAMILLMTSFEREAHRRIFQDATHFLRPSTARTVPIQKYHAGWNEKNAVVQRITLRDARTVPVASPSAMILQLKKENYHLALFTFKGLWQVWFGRVLFDGDRCHPDDDARRQVPSAKLTHS